MPVFSFTAPHITPEEEQKERDSLTEEMREELKHDLYGDVVAHEAEEEEKDELKEEEGRLATALNELDIILEETPASRKKDYLDAQTRAPHLVDTEANPRKFLRCENYHAEAAATRMLFYWKMRRKLFGDDRAFLPLTLNTPTNNGALRDDVEIVQAGLLAIHPPDEKGRGVLFFDRIRAIPPLAERDAALRAILYFIHIMSEDVTMQKHGIVCLTNIKGYDLYKHFDRLLSKQFSVLLLHCMPVKMKAWHMMAGSAYGVMSLVLPVMKQVVAKECRLRMVVHSGTDSKMLESLKPYGITNKNVSHVLSGDFKHSDFLDWLDGWREQERERDETR